MVRHIIDLALVVQRIEDKYNTLGPSEEYAGYVAACVDFGLHPRVPELIERRILSQRALALAHSGDTDIPVPIGEGDYLFVFREEVKRVDDELRAIVREDNTLVHLDEAMGLPTK